MSNITIQKYAPKILHQYIDNISVYNLDDNFEMELFPKGAFEIVFQNNSNFEHNTSYTTNWEKRPKNFIGGLHNKHYSIKSNEKNNSLICVQFKPHKAKNFISDKLNLFKNELVQASDIWGSSVNDLSEKLAKKNHINTKIQYIEQFFIDKLIDKRESSIDKALQCIHFKNGFISVYKLAFEVGLSESQFRKRFNEEIGISPSQYCKILRANYIRSILQKNQEKSLTKLAYDLGYFDQSYFIKDFKSVVGISPKKFLMTQ